MSVAFPRPHAQPWVLPSSPGRDCPSPPLAIRHRKKSRGQDGAVALPKTAGGLWGWGPRLLGWCVSGELGRPSLRAEENRMVGCVVPETRTAQACLFCDQKQV